jgi:pimeloyl-ACP methyl ester carboxylesterase
MRLLSLPLDLTRRLLGRGRRRFVYLTGRPDPALQRERLARPGWSATELALDGSFSAHALVRRPPAPDAPWLVFLPGNDSDQLAQGQAFLSHFEELPWGLLTLGYRGFDASEPAPRLSALTRDAQRLLPILCQAEGIQPSSLHVVAFSLGGYLACAAVSAASTEQLRPATLTLLASVYDVVMVRASRWQKLDPGERCQTRPLLGALPGPVLLMQGTNDEAFLGAREGRALAAALGSRARYLELEGVGHVELLSNPQTFAELRSFVGSHAKLSADLHEDGGQVRESSCP